MLSRIPIPRSVIMLLVILIGFVGTFLISLFALPQIAPVGLAREASVLGPSVSVIANMTLYAGPGSEYEPMGNLPIGEIIFVKEVSVDGGWYQIASNRSNVDAWIAAAGVQFIAQSNTQTPGPTSPTAEATPTLLPAPTLLNPEDNVYFGAPTVLLEWSPVQDVLSEDQFYLVAIDFHHQGHLWTDYVWTKQTSWSMMEHDYLLSYSDDGEFRWSVQLVYDRNRNPRKLSELIAISSRSTARLMIWNESIEPGQLSATDGRNPSTPTIGTPRPVTPPPLVTRPHPTRPTPVRPVSTQAVVVGDTNRTGIVILGLGASMGLGLLSIINFSPSRKRTPGKVDK